MPSRRHSLLAATLGSLASVVTFGGCGDGTPTAAPAVAAPEAPATSSAASTPPASTPPASTPPASTPPAAVASDPQAPATAAAATASDLTATTSKDEVKIMKEYWEGTRILKFTYEMRRGANGRWDRNGMSQAYYANGKLEREGPYKDGKRVGMWTYYDEAGKVLRTENRGGASGAPASGGAARSAPSGQTSGGTSSGTSGDPHDGPHDGHDH